MIAWQDISLIDFLSPHPLDMTLKHMDLGWACIGMAQNALRGKEKYGIFFFSYIWDDSQLPGTQYDLESGTGTETGTWDTALGDSGVVGMLFDFKIQKLKSK